MNEARNYHSSCVVRNKIYVFGGRDSSMGPCTKSIEILTGSVWSIIREAFLQARYQPMVSVINDKTILICGGMSDQGRLSDV